MISKRHGIAYLNKGQFDRAISNFTKAIEVNPKFAMTYNNRAVCCFYKKEYDNAWNNVKKAQALGYQIHPKFLKMLREASGRDK